MSCTGSSVHSVEESGLAACNDDKEEEVDDNDDSSDNLAFDALGAPISVKHCPVRGKTSPYWQVYHALKVPLVSNKRKKGNGASSLLPRTHICLLCLKSLKGKTCRSSTAWKTATCQVQTPANAHHHLMKKQSDDHGVGILLAKKNIAFDTAVTQSNVSTTLSQVSTLTKSTSGSATLNIAPVRGATPTNCFQRSTEKGVQLAMARWIIYKSKPLNAIYSDLFKAMFESMIGKRFAPMARDTFGLYLDREFNIFVDAVMKMLLQAMDKMYGLCFLQVVHDMWTSAGNNNLLGSCLCFVDSNFTRHIIPTFLVVNNVSQGAQYNADT